MKKFLVIFLFSFVAFFSCRKQIGTGNPPVISITGVAVPISDPNPSSDTARFYFGVNWDDFLGQDASEGVSASDVEDGDLTGNIEDSKGPVLFFVPTLRSQYVESYLRYANPNFSSEEIEYYSQNILQSGDYKGAWKANVRYTVSDTDGNIATKTMTVYGIVWD
jgi:hypothetical protein